jgi:hypothetical protein
MRKVSTQKGQLREDTSYRMRLGPPGKNRPPRLAVDRFWPRGELLKPRQCSIAFLEPCSASGMRTNEERVVAAVGLLGTIQLESQESHSLFNPALAGGRAPH